ncbi:MAG: hypothetical protein ACYDGR_17130 [Candidatus Dormibacteria bacterium]
MAFFNGDNGGATYQGVTKEEIRILIYVEGLPSGSSWFATSDGKEAYPAPGSYFDLGQPPSGPDGNFVFLRAARWYQAYFNQRFQTYRRFAHFYVAFGTLNSTGNADPSTRRADAAENIQRIHPFAVIPYAIASAVSYDEAMANAGVLVFVGNPVLQAGAIGEDAAFYQAHAKLVWSYIPSLDQRASMFSSFVCSQAVPFPVSFSRDPTFQGQTRTLGLISVDSPAYPELTEYGGFVQKDVQACGGTITLVQHFSDPSSSIGTPGSPSEAQTIMANFKKAGVTSLLWAGGFNESFTKAATAVGYLPEWIVAGDNLLDENLAGQTQDQNQWADARVVSEYTQALDPPTQPCYEAVISVDPSAPSLDIRNTACVFYPDFRELFIGIQVAGPRLSPTTLDQGYHAIPAVSSTDPRVPACYYLPGDYTCVKDAMVEWWNSAGKDPSGNPSCYAMMESGKRYRDGFWPKRDVDAARSVTNDQCNYQGLEVH